MHKAPHPGFALYPTLFTLSPACCSMLRTQFRTLLKDAVSVISYTRRMPMAPR